VLEIIGLGPHTSQCTNSNGLRAIIEVVKVNLCDLAKQQASH
jgi:hypothetical protein